MESVHPDPEDLQKSLERLVHQLLLAETGDLSGPQTAAFLRGWTAMLELVRRTDLTLPGATVELVAAVQRLADAVERAQRAALADPEP